MTNPSTEIALLMEKYLEGKASPQERQQVLDWYRAVDHSHIEIPLDTKQEITERRARMLAVLREHVANTRIPVHSVRLQRWAAAAAVLILLAGGAVYFRMGRHTENTGTAAVSSYPGDVKPGHNGAILTLADGSIKVLDSLQGGLIATQGNTHVKLENGRLLYTASARHQPVGEVTYNTMTTPRGRQYQLVLPDGTRVWLNAASSLRYPTAFTGQDRVVEMTGEVYFEVQHDKKPFRVKVAGQVIEDLGTHFNVNAYIDEPAMTTTLLEGSVKVNTAILKPGEQAVSLAGRTVTVSAADVTGAVAWKNGAFAFSNAGLPAVLRQLARWYDVEVEYRGAIPGRRFSGELGRSLSLSQVLRVLTKTDIRYQIENGNKLIILPSN